MTPKDLINWSELSRFLTRGDRGGIRMNKIPKKHSSRVEALVKLIEDWQKTCYQT